jgi:hypothetical protein
MITQSTFFKMALAFPATEQVPHFDRIGFKVIGRRMFSTYLAKDHTANIFLLPKEQKHFCTKHDEGIYPVPNKWGEKGATTFDLNLVPKEVVQEALAVAHEKVMQQKRK